MTEQNSKDIREQLHEVISHLEHVLPEQGPIKDFVHQNTLQGFQQLDFAQALKTTKELTGTSGYLPEEQFRLLYQQGRITRNELEQALRENEAFQCDTTLLKTKNTSLSKLDIHIANLLYPITPITGYQLSWQIEEMDALCRFQNDVSETARNALLSGATENCEDEAINALWQTCLQQLDLQHYMLHPEELIDLNPERADEILKSYDAEGKKYDASESTWLHRAVHKEARNLLGQHIRKVGFDTTMRGFLLTLTGEDILDDIRPLMLRHVSNYLDLGMSAWHSTERELGFYAAWRHSAGSDLNWIFEQLPEWQDTVQTLPDDALEAVIEELNRLGIPETHWSHYLERLALELPGWSGMFVWRHMHPGYAHSEQPVNMMDYLAVRLVLERLFAQRLCRQHWQLEANLDVLRWYFRRRRSEFYTRYHLFNSRLPEYLVTLAQKQLSRSRGLTSEYNPWKDISDMIMSWLQSPMSGYEQGFSVFNHGWRLFKLAQYCGLNAQDINALETEQLTEIFNTLDLLDEDTKGYIWLQAYERHYRDQLFNAVVKNHQRGRWPQRDQRPESQIVFCMDDREEGIRRHLEELNPMIETMGAAGFFGVAINWKGLDDEDLTPLCPIVVTPSHNIRERATDDAMLDRHKQRHSLRLRLNNLFKQETRRSLLSPFIITLAAPLSLLSLLGKTFPYRFTGQKLERLRNRFDVTITTRVAINAESIEEAPSPEYPQQGFTDEEQADRVQNFLRTIGLTQGLAQFVVLMGHGSSSVNNPHLAAYDCGACSGRHGGPNARAFAAMANRSEVRELLKTRGIEIPDDTLFMGAEHNTGNEDIRWYDADLIPETHQAAFNKLNNELSQAADKSAHERCRRLASAPQQASLSRSLRHIVGRSYDFSQARPELGHATNAAAFIGRRSISQGAFFDRRVFLISYDPTQDDNEGSIVEAILLAAGPVGAGINLEYYFSTVNNDIYGSGSKITHNVTGLFGVMDGTSGDLRTGLPKQMIEIHEAMRLQVLVEAKTEVLTKIYQRQPALQELVGNGWLLLSAKDPDSEQISVFVPDRGFVPWQGEDSDLPIVDDSSQWYEGHDQPLPPALIRQQVNNA